jgi:hypothetical protein
MNKELAPYEQALALKELEFDEPCFGYYSNGELVYGNHTNNYMQRFRYSAPLYQQAFRWFREKDLYCIVYKYHDGFAYEVYGEGLQVIKEPFNTYEEAELQCLKELIKIVKNK